MSFVRHAFVLLSVIHLLAAGTAWAEERRAIVHVTFAGTSTLHDFSGTVQSSDVACEASSNGVEMVTVRVPVMEMKTGHDGRDARMYKMFHADTHPLIEGQADRSSLTADGATAVPLRMTLHGVTREVEAERSPAPSEGPSTVRLAFALSLKAFDLEAPSVVGLIRVKDTVQVSVLLDTDALPKPATRAENGPAS